MGHSRGSRVSGWCRSKNTTLNLGGARAVLDRTLFRGNELIPGSADPYHVPRLFTKFLPNAREVFALCVKKHAVMDEYAASFFLGSRDVAGCSGRGGPTTICLICHGALLILSAFIFRWICHY